MNRHPDIKSRMAQVLSRQCSDGPYDNLLLWFNELRGYLAQIGHVNILKDPSRSYNCDEMESLMAPKLGKVLAAKGDAHIYQAGTNSSKLQITILLAASASGHYIPPLIVYLGVQPRNQLREDFHNKFLQGHIRNSPSGWMDMELFIAWLKNGFLEVSIPERYRS